MRIHRVSLRNYRGVDDCTVEFPTTGITVVEGDNEVGKTCIPEAVDLILNELDSSNKQRVRAIRPVHRDVGPEVEVEISTGGYQFTYFKRWHRQPETTLKIAAPQREQLTGREAHERVKAILDETLDDELWKALTIEQNANLDLPGFEGQSLGQALDLAAGGEQVSDSGDALWERICTERGRHWTGTGKDSQERKSLADRVGKALGEIEELENKLLAIENDAEEVARLAKEEHRLAELCDQVGRDEQQLSEQWASAETLRTKVDRLEADRRAADAELAQVADAHQGRQGLVGALGARREELDALQKRAEQSEPSLVLVNTRCEEADAALSAARDARRAAEQEQRLAVEDRDHHQRQIDKELLSERLERVLAAQEELKAAESVLASSEVDKELVTKIEQASNKMTRAEAALSASAASVELSAQAPISVLIDGEGAELGPGIARHADITDRWELVVPNAVRVLVQPGAGSRNLVADLESAKEEHDRLCTQGGVGNLVEARRKAEARLVAERQRDNAAQTIDRDLRDLTPEVMAQKVDGLARRIAAYPPPRPESRPLPNSLEVAKRIAWDATSALETQMAEVQRCETNEREANEARQSFAVEAAELDGKLSIAQAAHLEAERRLDEARERQSDSSLDETLASQRDKAETAAAALEEAQEELDAQDPEVLEAKLSNARDARNRVEADLRKNKDRQLELGGSLKALSRDGLHSQLEDARTEYEHLVREHERLESRAQAARLLYEAFERRRQEARQRYIAPFKSKIEQFGRIVFGRSFEVELDDDLRVARRTLDGITLDVAQLSVGAREQLGVICRLACAAIVSPDGGGAPVMIDDALGWSDPTRLQNMGAAINKAGRECQVIVLTCTPGRYAHVGNAKVVRLPN